MAFGRQTDAYASVFTYKFRSKPHGTGIDHGGRSQTAAYDLARHRNIRIRIAGYLILVSDKSDQSLGIGTPFNLKNPAHSIGIAGIATYPPHSICGIDNDSALTQNGNSGGNILV